MRLKTSARVLLPVLLTVFLAVLLAAVFAPPARAYYEPGTGMAPGYDEILEDVLDNPLGDQTNRAFEPTAGGSLGPNQISWFGDAMQAMVLNSYVGLGGEGALSGSGTAGGALAVITGMSTHLLQNPPDLRTAAFLRHTLADNVLSQPAYARTGAETLSAVAPIWAVFRNLAYTFSVIIFILMGFMVMFQSQASPRTTVTFTTVLPRIVFSLILITFSYPLAGLVVDFGRVLKGLIDSQFSVLFGGMIQVEPFEMMFSTVGNYTTTSIFSLGGIANMLKGFVGRSNSNIYLGGTGFSSVLISHVIQWIAFIVCFIIFFQLVFRFASIFMQTIFAPLAFLWGAMPGQEDTTTRWFKSFAVNVFSIPAIYFIVNLSDYIAWWTQQAGQDMPLPGDLGWGTLGGISQTDVGGLVSFGLLVAATRVPAMLEDAFAVTTSAAVARAGVEPGKIAARLPLVGRVFK